jgi:inosine/xanthosine triphosphate pyrophosphatase family protein
VFPNKNGFSHPRFVQQVESAELPVFYISSSSRKKRLQLSWILSHYNLKSDYYSPPIDLVEPQLDLIGRDSEILLVSHPLKQIARFIKIDKTPFLVEDTMLFIERFNKNYDTEPELPGMDTKRWWRQLGNKGVLELLGNSSKRRARYVSQVGCYLGSGKYFYGRGELNGVIASKIQNTQESEQNFPRTNPLFFHKIFVPNGFQRTLGELNKQEFAMVDYRKKAIEDLLEKMRGENIRCSAQLSLPFGDEQLG